MKLYHEHRENNCKELLGYYPRYYRNVREMQAILYAFGMILDRLEENIERVFLNCFVDSADAETITNFETFLKIISDKRSLEERRKFIKSFLIGFGKFSASVLIEMLSTYTDGDIQCRLEPSADSSEQILYIDILSRKTNIDDYLQDDIKYLIEKRIPAHISYRISYCYTISAETAILYAAAGNGNPHVIQTTRAETKKSVLVLRIFTLASAVIQVAFKR